MLHPPPIPSLPSRPQLGFRIWRIALPGTALGEDPISGTMVMAPEKLDGLVYSVAFPLLWTPGANTASCLFSRTPHLAPDANCACGMWCYKVPHSFLKSDSLYKAGRIRILGAILYWGHCVEHHTGVRVQHAQILAFHQGEVTPRVAAMCSAKYDAPCFTHLEGFLEYAHEFVDSSDKPLFDVTVAGEQ